MNKEGETSFVKKYILKKYDKLAKYLEGKRQLFASLVMHNLLLDKNIQHLNTYSELIPHCICILGNTVKYNWCPINICLQRLLNCKIDDRGPSKQTYIHFWDGDDLEM